MSNKELWEKRNGFLFILGYFAIGYLLTNWVNDFRCHYYSVAFSFEADIPFFPIFIFGYMFTYLSVVILYFLLDDINLFRRSLLSFFVLSTFTYMIFLVFPVQMAYRPDLDLISGNGITDVAVRAIFIIDRPNNLFPSLHIAYPMLSVLLIWRTHHVWRWVLLAMTVIVAISVVMVKQHYLMDVVGGVVAAFICYALVIKTEKLWLRIFYKKNSKDTDKQTF